MTHILKINQPQIAPSFYTIMQMTYNHAFLGHPVFHPHHPRYKTWLLIICLLISYERIPALHKLDSTNIGTRCLDLCAHKNHHFEHTVLTHRLNLVQF